MQWMLNLSLAAQTTKSQRLQHQEFIWKKDLQRPEPSSAIAEMAREKDKGISWGQRPAPAYEDGNFHLILDSGPPSDRLLKDTQNSNIKFLAIP